MAQLDLSQAQWAKPGVQAIELTLAMRRLTRADWKDRLYIVKLDVAKAFDSISQLLSTWAKKGGQPWEALVWLYLIRARSVTVVLQGSKLEIVQGSPDSPAIFRASIGETIDEVLKEMGGISRRTPNCHRAHIGVPASWTTCTCGVITDVGLSKRQSASKTSRQCCWGAGGGGQ